MRMCKHTPTAGAEREKWVRLTRSVSLHLQHSRSPTVRHYTCKHTHKHTHHLHTHTQNQENINVFSHQLAQTQYFTLGEVNIFTFECNTHTQLHIYLLPLLEHMNTQRSCVSLQMQSTNLLTPCIAKWMCLPKSQAQNKIWTQNPSEIHCANLFNRCDGYFRSGDSFQMYISAADSYCCGCTHIHHTAHAHMHMYNSGDGKALSTGGGISEQNRCQTRLPFSKLMLVFVYVCVCPFGMFWHIHIECTLTQWHPFRSWCPGMSVAVLNDANISNEIPIFSSREEKRPASRHSRRVK